MQGRSRVFSEVRKLRNSFAEQIEEVMTGRKKIPPPLEFFDQYLIPNPLMMEARSSVLPLFWQDIIHHVLTERRWYYIPLPRNFYKTSYLTVGCNIYRICENDEYAGGIVSVKANLAQDMLMRVRNTLEVNDDIIKDFGPFRERNNPWSRSEFRIKRRNKHNTLATLFAVGIRGAMTGRRADALYFDDVEDHDTVNTIDTRAKTMQWIGVTIPIIKTRASDGNPGQLIVIGTRKHPSDMYSRILSGDLKAWTLWDAGYRGPDLESMAETISENVASMEVLSV